MAALLVLVSVLNRKPRQSRKEATVVIDAGDAMRRIALPILLYILFLLDLFYFLKHKY